MATRNRLTDQAIADVQKADKAILLPSKSGYKVELCNDKACVKLFDRHNRSVIYTSKVSAKKAILRHNPEIEISLKSRLE